MKSLVPPALVQPARPKSKAKWRPQLRLSDLEARVVPAAVHWTGNGDGASWEDVRNWDTNAVPAASDDVVIDVPGTPTVTLTADTVTVRSLASQENVVLDGASLTVTGGNSDIAGSFATSGGTLTATGPGTTFTADGPTTLDTTSLYAWNGAGLSLPGLTSFAVARELFVSYHEWRADGAGSQINLPGLTTIGPLDNHFLVRAFNGGSVDMPAVATGGGFAVQADGTGSRVSMPALPNFDHRADDASLSATNGATISLDPALTALDGTDITVDATGDLPVDQFTKIANGSLTLTAPRSFTLANLTSLTVSNLSVTGGSYALSGLTTLDTAGLYALGGAGLILPGAITFGTDSNPYGSPYREWRADGAGSAISLPALAGFGAIGHTLVVRALNGGSVDLPTLGAAAGGVQVQADGAGSRIRLPALAQFDHGTLSATNGAVVDLDPELAMLNGTTVAVDGTGNLPVDQFTAITDGGSLAITTGPGGPRFTLANLATLTDSSLTVDGGGYTLSALTALRSAFLYASGGATLTLPAATSYAVDPAPYGSPYLEWRADGAGSAIALPALTAIPALGRSLLARAFDGGRVDLPALASVAPSFTAQADGAGSRVSILALPRLDHGTLSATNGAAVELDPALTTLDGTDVTVDATGDLSVDQITRLTDGSLTISTGPGGPRFTLANLTDLSASALTVHGGNYALSALTAADTSSLYAADGASLTFPALTALAVDRELFVSYHEWRADGAGSAIHLPGLTDINRLDNNFLFRAFAGGTVDSPALTHVAPGLTLQADGPGSTIGLAALPRLENASLYMTNGGTVLTPKVRQFSAVSIGTDPTATFTVPAGTVLDAGNGTTSVQTGTLLVDGELSTGTAGLTTVSGPLRVDGLGVITGTGTLKLPGDVTGTTRNADEFRPLGTVTLTSATGTTSAPQRVEAMSADLGAVQAGFDRNFAYGTLSLAPNTYAQLADLADNVPGAGPEALYAGELVVPAGATLDLNGLHLYVRGAQIAGTVVGGTVTQVPDGGALKLDAPAQGGLLPAGQVDDWTFYGRAGATVAVQLTTGTGPQDPPLGWGRVTLLDPNGIPVADGSNPSQGAAVTLGGNLLPMDGMYTVRVQAAPGHSDATGNYLVGAYSAPTTDRPLVVNQAAGGTLPNAFAADRWTFAAAAGDQVQLLLTSATPGMTFDLTGPGGSVVFAQLSADSAVVTLSATGPYALAVHGPAAGGSYAFRLATTSVADLALGTPVAVPLTASGDARLFRMHVPSPEALVLTLAGPAPADHTELYAKLGGVPTRGSFDASSAGTGPDHGIVIPSAAPGDWYVLVYGESVGTPGTATLTAMSEIVHLASVAPDRSAAGAVATLTLAGTGFDGRTTAELVAADGATYPATDVSLDTFTQLTATFDLTGVPQAQYGVRVRRPGGSTAELPAAFTVAAPGAPHLETDLILPDSLGFHIASTLYVEYSNTGTAAMPAPLLIMESPQPENRPLLTLDPSRVTAGFWTSALPVGYSNTIEILASGKTPGVLQPGESVTVPVYYAGMQAPFSFDSELDFDLGTVAADDTDPIDWASLRDDLQPPNMTAGAWAALYGTVTGAIGNTWGGFVGTLDRNASYLARLGETTSDIGRLWQFEVEQADRLAPVGELASATDLDLPAPGLGLSFDRDYATPLDSRYRSGPLGFGWTDDWQYSLTTAADGTVAVTTPSGYKRIFQPDSRNDSFFAQPGDYGVLRADAGRAYFLTETDGTVSHFSADGTLDYVQDTNGNRVTAGYASGRLTGLTHSSGQSLAIAYNAAGRIASVTSSDGRVVAYDYDPTNQYLMAVHHVDGTVTRYTYDTGSNRATAHALTSVEFPDGTQRLYGYDAAGRLAVSSLDGGAEAVSYGYNLGRVSVTDLSGATAQYYFDDRGRLAKEVDPLGNAAFAAYDGNDNPTLLTGPTGLTQTLAYDSYGNMIRSTDALGRTTRFTYTTGFNRLASMTDARGITTNYQYDTRGNLTATVYSDHSAAGATFDALGDPLTLTNPNRQTASYAYNAAGQPTSMTLADGSTTTFGYDARGNLTSTADATGTTTLTYDTGNRLTRVSYPTGRFLQYTYDAAGRRTRMADQMGFTVEYTYDARGRLAGLTDGIGAAIVSYTYDAVGRLAREDKGNGTYTTYEYDAAGNVLHLINFAPDGTVNSRFDYTYDALGEPVSMATVDGTWAYDYDSIGQLVRADFTSINPVVPSQDLSYAYDAAGNRTQTVENGVLSTYTTNERNQYTTVTSPDGTTTSRYDRAGNLVSTTDATGTTTYGYDSLSRLVSVTSPTDSWVYQYDALGNRAVTIHNGQRSEDLFDPTSLGTIESGYNSAGTATAAFAYGFGLVSRADSSGTQYYDFDLLGSTAGLTNSSGQYADTYTYSPFGETLASTSTVSNDFQFVGRAGVKTSSGIGTLMRARAYNPETGRFDTADPLGLKGGDTDFYRYARNSVTSITDPSGLDFANNVAEIVGGVGTALAVALTPEVTIPVLIIGSFTGGYVAGDGIAHLWLGDGGSSGGRNAGGPGGSNSGGPGNGSGGSSDGGSNSGGAGNGGSSNGGGGSHAGGSHGNGGDHGGGSAGGRGHGGVGAPAGGAKPPTKKIKDPKKKKSKGARSRDPNALLGPAGAGPENYVSADATLPYTIEFENDPTATAPTHQVTVTNTLDPNLDPSTFQLTEVTFGDIRLDVPAGSRHFQTTVPMTYNGVTFDVDIDVGLDTDRGQVVARFMSIDPLTWLPPDALTGFLPPEDGTGRGQGHISYTIRPTAGLATGTVVRNVASVTFDVNPAITTDQVDPHDPSRGVDPAKQAVVTIDADAPAAAVDPLPEFSVGGSVPVAWRGTDVGAGVDSFDVLVSTDGGPLQAWLSGTRDMAATFPGAKGHTYGFAAVARDLAGNTQAIPVSPQATVRVGLKPTALEDVFAVAPGKKLTGSVVANDVKGASKATATLVAPPTQGALALKADGTFTYTANVDSSGRDFFAYKLVTTAGESNVARVDLATHPVNFRATVVKAVEGATAKLVVALNRPATAPIVVAYAVSPRSATPGADFALADGTVSFAAGEQTKTITIPITQDSLDEANETFQVRLTGATGPAAVGEAGTATLTIVDDDAAPSVSFRERASAAGEDVSPALEVVLSAPSGRPVTVAYAARDGSAKVGSDYTLPAGTLTFLPGETSKTIPLTVVDDSAEEPDETVIAALSKPTNAVLGPIPKHTHTILANDPARSVGFETTTATVSEGARTATLTVVLSSAAKFPVSVNYGIDPAGTTATAGRDFTLAPGTLTFRPGETRKTITVRIIDDRAPEPTETLAVRLASAVNAILGTADAFTLSIADDDS